jgi:hypothetical protein
MNMPGLSSCVRITHIACYWKFFLCTTHKSPVGTGFTEQITPILRILCYNGSLVTRILRSLLSHVIAIKPVHWCAGCCLATVVARTTQKILSCCARLNVFTESLRSSGHTHHNILWHVNIPQRTAKETHCHTSVCTSAYLRREVGHNLASSRLLPTSQRSYERACHRQKNKNKNIRAEAISS